MQVFDENGKFLDMWPLRSPYWPADISTLVTNHIITQDQFIWAGDGGTNRILKFDLNGNFLYSWGGPGGQPGQLNCPHGFSTDQDGNLYVADCSAAACRNSRRSRMPTRQSWWARSCVTEDMNFRTQHPAPSTCSQHLSTKHLALSNSEFRIPNS